MPVTALLHFLCNLADRPPVISAKSSGAAFVGAIIICGTVASAVLAQNGGGGGYNVSDYKPATLNDSYKPGQAIIFKGASGVAAPPAASSTARPYAAPGRGQSKYILPSSGVSRSYSNRTSSAPQLNEHSSSHNHRSINKDADEKLKTKNKSEPEREHAPEPKPATAEIPSPVVKPAQVHADVKTTQPVAIETKPPKPEPGTSSAAALMSADSEPSLPARSAPTISVSTSSSSSSSSSSGLSSSSASTASTALSSVPPVVTKTSPPEVAPPKPLTWFDLGLTIAGAVLYALSVYASVRFFSYVKPESADAYFTESIRPLHSVLLRRSHGPRPVGELPYAIEEASFIPTQVPRLKTRATKSRINVAANLESLKAALSAKLHSDIELTDAPTKRPLVAAGLSLIPGVGHFYNGQNVRGTLLLLMALLINPFVLVMISMVGIEYLLSTCMNMQVVISQDIANLLVSLKDIQNNILLPASCLFLVLLLPAMHDAYSFAKHPRIKRRGELSLFDTGAAAVLLSVVIFFFLFLAAILGAPSSSTGNLTRVTYVDVEVNAPIVDQKAKQEKPNKSTQSIKVPSKNSNISPQAVRTFQTKADQAKQLGEEDPAAKSSPAPTNDRESPEALEHTAPPLSQVLDGTEAPDEHLKRPLADKAKHSDTTAGQLSQPILSSQQQSGIDQDKQVESTMNQDQRLLDIPKVDSLPQPLSASDSQRALAGTDENMKKLQWDAAYQAANKALALNGRNADAYRLRAKVEEKVGRYAAAMNDSAKAIALNRKDSEMFLLRGRVLMNGLREYSDAIVSLNEAMTLNPALDEALAVRGRSRLYLGDLTGAQEDMYAAFKINPKSAPALVLRSDIRSYFGDAVGAKKDARLATEIEPTYSRAWRALAQYTLNLKAFDGSGGAEADAAFKLINKGGMLEPGDPYNILIFAECLACQARNHPEAGGEAKLDAAIKQFDTAVEGTHSVEALYERALAERMANYKGDSARDWLEVQASGAGNLRRPPEGAVPQLFRTHSEYLQKVEECTKLLARDPLNKKLYHDRGHAYSVLEQKDKALADFNQALTIDPNYADCYDQRSIIYRQLKQRQKAIDDLTQLIRCDKDPRYTDHSIQSAYMERGMQYFQQGDYDKTIDDLTNCITMTKKTDYVSLGDAYQTRGNAYFLVGKYDLAITDANQVIKLDPANLGAVMNRGEAELKLGMLQDAMRDLKQGIETVSVEKDKQDQGEGYYFMAQLHDKMGQHDLALQDLSKSKEFGFVPIKGQ